MIDYYRTIRKDYTEKVGQCINFYESRNLSFQKYYDLYDSIDLINSVNSVNEYLDIFSPEDEIDYVKCCLQDSIKQIIDNKSYTSDIQDEINIYKKEFQYYPDLKEKDFIKQLTLKKELGMNAVSNEIVTIEDKCNINFFELAPHQIFLKNLFSKNTPYNSILIFHGVGVGKTCSGVSIAENFKDIYGSKEKRTIILASKNIQIGWKKTINDPKKQGNQCTGDTYHTDVTESVEIVKESSKIIKKYYEMHGYASFSNTVKRLLTAGTKHIPESDIKQRLIVERQLIQVNYSNRVLIIDEAHNIRGDGNAADVRDTIKYISKVIEYSDDLKLILLTANPMFNVSTEIVWIINMLLLNDKRTPITEKIFDEDGIITDRGTSIIREKSKGYISYLRGENPISFPVRIYPTHNPNKITTKSNSPIMDIFGNDINREDRLSFLDLYSSTLQGQQKDVYELEVQKYIGQKALQIQGENKLLEISNMVYPVDDIHSETSSGDIGLTNCFTKTMKNKSPQYSYITEESFLDYDLIGDYSAKIKSILEIIAKSKGIVFIYTNWIKAGIIPLVLALEQNGYAKHDGSEILKTDDKREPVSYSPDEEDEFKQAKYMVIAGGQENLTHNLKEELETLTSKDNIDGRLIKVVIGSKVASEGLDFKCIRSIHIMEPWHNINKLEQVIGRGIRNCSHTLLPPEERNITIYLHNSFLDSNNETIDTYLYRYSEKKAKEIGKIETILKQNAIDQYLFKGVNYLAEEDVQPIFVKPSHIDSVGTIHNPHDKDGSYSRVCSFQETCNYFEDSFLIDKSKFTEDTFQMKYSQGLIDIYKKRIIFLFSNNLAYSYEEIIQELSNYKENDETILVQGLEQLIHNKDMIRNNSNNGYLRYFNNVFIFQPYFNTDQFLPPYYRIHKGNIKYNHLSILSREERKNKIMNEKVSYGTSIDGPIQTLYKNILSYRGSRSEINIMKYVSFDDSIRYQYCIDRLSFEKRKILLYSLLYSLKEEVEVNESFQKHLLKIIQSTFIYYDEDTESFDYYPVYNSENKLSLVGGFVYHHYNKEPIFYKYESGELSAFNKIDQANILKKLRQVNKTFLSFDNSWGYPTYSTRYKKNDNGIIMKIVKGNQKKVSYPPGPGNICRDSNNNIGGTTSEETLRFIMKDPELSKIFLKSGETNKEYQLKLEDYKRSKSKIEYSIFIEYCFRKLGRFISTDLIWFKYI